MRRLVAALSLFCWLETTVYAAPADQSAVSPPPTVKDQAAHAAIFGGVLAAISLTVMGIGFAADLGRDIGDGVADTFNALGGNPPPERAERSVDPMVTGGAIGGVLGGSFLIAGLVVYLVADEPPLAVAIAPTQGGGVVGAAWRF